MLSSSVMFVTCPCDTNNTVIRKELSNRRQLSGGGDQASWKMTPIQTCVLRGEEKGGDWSAAILSRLEALVVQDDA